MREIKFRVWRTKIKEMGKVDSINFREGEVHCSDNSFGYPKDECILMQFTGLKDKNRKEIYEGDIVKVIEIISKGKLEVKYPEMVVFEEGSFWLETLDKKCPEKCKQNFICVIGRKLEIIGNFYENPELLK